MTEAAVAGETAPAPPAQKDVWRKGRKPPLSARVRALGALPRRLLWQRLVYRLKRPYYRSPLYGIFLPRIESATPLCLPPDPWPGEAERGRALVDLRFTFAGQTLENPRPLWSPEQASKAWLEELHSFSWLRDLRACNGDPARRQARALTTEWMEKHRTWSSPAWDPLVIGRRLSHWLGQYDFFAASAEIDFRQKLLESAARQAAHLSSVLPAGLTGADLIVALRGLAIAGACLPDGQPWLKQALALLSRELTQQVLADGGHCERSPGRHLAVLRDLVDIKATLHAAGAPLPDELQLAIEGMGPTLRLLQHGDGGLALFNGSTAEEGFKVDMVLRRADARRRPRTSAPQTGFQRMQAGRTLVLLDSGSPAPPGLDMAAHAGTLSFEMSVGRERMIVNCGAPAGQTGSDALRQALRVTAAHSTLTLAETNSSLLSGGRAFWQTGLVARAENVLCRRNEEEGATLLETQHDGYAERLGALHRRMLYLAASGDDLRGEDRVEPSGADPFDRPLDFTVRFHLHPNVQAALVQTGDAVLLRLPKAGGWRLRCSGAAIALEDSVYFGDTQPRRSQQVVLRGRCGRDGARVKWALQREAVRDKPAGKR
ncbi:heparinase II/III family protein [Fodinicurvata halophila]|uniref:Heparinase II/III family protein n=1 Tax=Fodinicurvata halophila TaxID=1419723 RepID=A0ABV8UPN8_9PROT